MRKSALFYLGLVVTVLVLLGFVVLFSASEANGIRFGKDPYFFVKRQAVFLVSSVILCAIVAKLDYRIWRGWRLFGKFPFLTILFALVVLALLIAVFAFPAVKGSQRWIPLGRIRLQPSELAKLATGVVVAVWMDLQSWKVELFGRGAFVPFVLIWIFAGPIVLEPDFGSTMVVGAAGFLVMFLAGTKFVHLLPFGAAGVLGVLALILRNPNRVRRLGPFVQKFASFVSGDGGAGAAAAVTAAAKDPAAYQMEHSLTAINNGGIWGRGLYESLEKHSYLPEAHTDFIFSIGAEELGVFFSIAVIVLFIVFFLLAVKIARWSDDRLGRLLVAGMGFLIFFQASFNLGVVSGALPTKGMALPFFSYGGTNLLSSAFAIGTIFSVGIHSGRDRKRWKQI